MDLWGPGVSSMWECSVNLKVFVKDLGDGR